VVDLGHPGSGLTLARARVTTVGFRWSPMPPLGRHVEVAAAKTGRSI